MSNSSSYAAVVFDMDGVLIDSEPIVKICGQTAATHFGGELSDELYNELIGLPAADVELGLRSAFGEKFPMNEFRIMLEELWHAHVDMHGIAIKPGIEDALLRLQAHAVPYAIATSTPFERAQKSLQVAGLLHHFETIVGGDQVANGKPAPDIFIAAAGRLSAAPRHCIALEDSEVGVNAASRAGMYTIMIPDQKQPSQETREAAQEIFSSMTQALPRLVELLALDGTRL